MNRTEPPRHPIGMVSGSLRRDRRAVAGLAAVAVIWTVALLATGVGPLSLRPGTGLVEAAVAFDLVVTASAALYLIAVRGGHLPRWLLTVTVTGGMIVGKLVLARAGDAGHAAAVAAGALEVITVALVFARMRRARAGWRTARTAGAPPGPALEAALAATGLPAPVAVVIATELVVLAYATCGWRAPVATPARFTVHRLNGWLLYLGVFLFLVLVEGAVVHLLLSIVASSLAAWIVTGMTAYSALWLVGDAHALRHGGVVVAEAGLDVRIGVRWNGRIPWAAVRAIELGEAPVGALDASILGGNVVVHLREARALRRLFGRWRTGTAIALSIDDPARFLRETARYFQPD